MPTQEQLKQSVDKDAIKVEKFFKPRGKTK